MLEYLKYLLAGEELNELLKWRSTWNQYRRWLTPIPAMSVMLDNMNNEVTGKLPMCASHPPMSQGPWTIDGLRRQLELSQQGLVGFEEVDDGEWKANPISPAPESERLKDELIKTKLQLLEANRTIELQEVELKRTRMVCGDALHSIGRIVETGVQVTIKKETYQP
jgi:hypothetical protein